MFENITVGEIAAVVVFIAALITGGVKIKDSVKKWLESLLQDKFKEAEKANKKETDDIKKEITEIKKDIAAIKDDNRTIDLGSCKNFLVTFISDLKRGEVKDEVEKERFWEVYNHYIDVLKENGYIKSAVDELKAQKLI